MGGVRHFLDRIATKGNQGCCIASFGPSQLEYAAPIWNPHHQTEIDREGPEDCCACRHWRNQSRVGEMLEELQWPELQERRKQASLSFFDKIHNNLVTIDKNRYLSEAGCNRSTRSHPYHRPNAYMDGLKFSFFSGTIVTWNGVTTEAVSAKKFNGFKSKI